MKPYKQYLAESKKTYQFRIKLDNCEIENDLMTRLEHSLDQFDVLEISKPKSLPISRCIEFSKLGPCSRHIMDATVNYPTTSGNMRQAVHMGTGIPLDHIFVSTTLEDEMVRDPVSNHEDGPILNKNEMASDSAQDEVGLKKVESLLKELGKSRHAPEPYKGINDALLAKDLYKEKAAKRDDKIGTTSPVGSRQNKIPSPVKGR